MGRGEGGKEGGREKIRKCIVDFLRFGVFSSFPSLSPHPPCGFTGDWHTWGWLPVKIWGHCPHGRWGRPFHHRPLGAPPACAPTPQPSVPISTGQKAVGIPGRVAVHGRAGEKVHQWLALGHVLWAELWQPGKVPSLWHWDCRSLLQTQPPAGFRGAAKWALELSTRPFQQEMRCGCKPAVLGEVRFPVKCRAWAAPWPLSAPSPRKLLMSLLQHASSLKLTSLGVPSKL